jgi:hypothetical protein
MFLVNIRRRVARKLLERIKPLQRLGRQIVAATERALRPVPDLVPIKIRADRRDRAYPRD